MVKQHLSDYSQLNSEAPQGSRLRPVFFLLYASGLFKAAAKHFTNIHTYADDTQLYMSFKLVQSFHCKMQLTPLRIALQMNAPGWYPTVFSSMTQRLSL